MGAPSGFSASKVGSNIQLNWTNTALSVSSSGGCTAASRTANNVQKAPAGTSSWSTMANAGASATSWSGNPGDGTWKFRVQSVERSYETDDIFTCKLFNNIFNSAESGNFTFGSDTTPDAFDLGANTTGALLNSYYSAPNTVTVAGLSSGVSTAISISGTGAQYRKNGGAWTSAAGTVVNGDTIEVRVLSSSNRSTAITATLNIGGVTDTWTVTTTSDWITTVTLPSSGTIAMSMLRGAWGPKTGSSRMRDYLKNELYYDGDFSENTTLPLFTGAAFPMTTFYGRKGQWRLNNINSISTTVAYGSTAAANMQAVQVAPERMLEYKWLFPTTVSNGTLWALQSDTDVWSPDNYALSLRLASVDIGVPAIYNQTVTLQIRVKGLPDITSMYIPVFMRVNAGA